MYDLGGGTFDVTILSVNNRQYRVITTGGDTHLGGDDLDFIMMEILINAIEGNGGSVDRNNKRMMADPSFQGGSYQDRSITSRVPRV